MTRGAHKWIELHRWAMEHGPQEARLREALAPLGHTVESLHDGDPVEVLREASGVIVGGGNSFRLLERLGFRAAQENELEGHELSPSERLFVR